ncbi:MAG TPA: right-handed parallel beta-helix repeat-containing protein [Chitinophagaceae bacterium]|nr:right-handed parallel beta-helix repeat-containing protein [Chitinophagaceae bacterium]
MKAIATILIFISTLAHARSITLPKDAAGGAYRPMLDMNGVDTIVLKGKYKNVELAYYGIWGSPSKKIVIKSDPIDSASISGYGPYCMLINGEYFIIDGLKFTGFDTVFTATGLGIFESSNIEVRNCLFYQLQAGIVQNPIASRDMENNYFHDLVFVNFRNPANGGRTECFYLGNTKQTSPGKFRRCRLANIYIYDVSGDGIQLCQGSDFDLRNITIIKWGQAQLKEQRYGILIGNEANANIQDVLFDSGRGQAFQFLGTGRNSLKRATFRNIDLSGLVNEDVVYIRARSGDFFIDFSLSTFLNCRTDRKLIYNATPDSLTSGSIFCSNIGVEPPQTVLNKKDIWGCISLPIPEAPKPKPETRQRKDVTIYNNIYQLMGERKQVYVDEVIRQLQPQRIYILFYDKKFHLINKP